MKGGKVKGFAGGVELKKLLFLGIFITIWESCLWRLHGVTLASGPSGSFFCGLLFMLKTEIHYITYQVIYVQFVEIRNTLQVGWDGMAKN